VITLQYNITQIYNRQWLQEL